VISGRHFICLTAWIKATQYRNQVGLIFTVFLAVRPFYIDSGACSEYDEAIGRLVRFNCDVDWFWGPINEKVKAPKIMW